MMMKHSRSRHFHNLFLLFLFVSKVQAWTSSQGTTTKNQESRPYSTPLCRSLSRRDVFFLSIGAAALGTTTTSIYRAEAVVSINQKKVVSFSWDIQPTGKFPIAINGISNTPTGSDVKIQYTVPTVRLKDDTENNLRILVYQKTGTAAVTSLEKAAQGSWKIARALDIGDRFLGSSDLKEQLNSATLLKAIVNNQSTSTEGYDYDLVNTTTNYQYWIRTSIVKNRLYVFLLEYKQGGTNQYSAEDLSKIRSSFLVSQMNE